LTVRRGFRAQSSCFEPVVARSKTVRSAVAPVADDCIKLIFVRSGAATLCSEVGRHRIVSGDVVLLASNTLCGSEPQGTITVTTLYLDRDYLTDQVFWQLSAILRDRHEAGLLIDALYADPLRLIHLGEESAGRFAPWLDELVDGLGLPDLTRHGLRHTGAT
jgi:AraC family transcriptional regulator